MRPSRELKGIPERIQGKKLSETIHLARQGVAFKRGLRDQKASNLASMGGSAHS